MLLAAGSASAQTIGTQLTVGAAAAPSTTVAKVEAGQKVEAARYSDGLADTAKAALDSIAGRPQASTFAFAASAPTGKAAVAAGVPVQAPQTPAPSANAAPSTPTGEVVVAAQAAPTPNAVSANVGPSSESWNGAVIDTADLGAFAVGTLIETASAPASVAVLSSLPSDPTARYTAALRQLAKLVESRTGVDDQKLFNVWSSTDVRRMRAVLVAMAQVGTQYRYTGNQPGGFDCSGLTSYAWAQAGVKIPRTSTDQIAWAYPKSLGELQVGDLIWRPGHIGMYLGVGDAMVHSPQTGKAVEVRKIGKSSRYGGILEKLA